jgi:hypothetical protein
MMFIHSAIYLPAMALFKDFFSTSGTGKDSRGSRHKSGASSDALSRGSGPETKPVKMTLEERIVFRRELLYEIIRASLSSRSIPAHRYRFKVIRSDKRGHSFVVMLDMSPTLMASPAGDHASLNETAAVLINNAATKYGLVVGAVYWRSDETLDVSVDDWARPAAPSLGAHSADGERQSHGGALDAMTADEMSAFEAAWQNKQPVQIGDRFYSSDLVPFTDETPDK